MSVNFSSASTVVGAHLGHPQRRGLLELEDRDAGRDQRLQRGGDVLELDRLVTDVEHDPEVPPDQADASDTGRPASAASSSMPARE